MRLPTVVVRGDVLSSWLTVSDYSKTRLAAELGVSKGRISQLLTSQEEPSAHLMAKLLIVTHLPFERLFKTVTSQPPARLTRRSGNLIPRTSRTTNGGKHGHTTRGAEGGGTSTPSNERTRHGE